MQQNNKFDYNYSIRLLHFANQNNITRTMMIYIRHDVDNYYFGASFGSLNCITLLQHY